MEVVPGDDPEYVRPDHEGLELAIPPSKETRDLPTIEQRPGSKRICGLSTKVFLLVVVVCLVVVTAAVGGGVGGSVKNRKASDAESLNQRYGISSALGTEFASKLTCCTLAAVQAFHLHSQPLVQPPTQAIVIP